MDAFESVIAMLLRRDGYWTHPSFKVELSAEEKQKIGRPNCPRWETDMIAYKPAKNELLVVECKSFLDSDGVKFRNGQFEKATSYKLFGEDVLREVVLNRLVSQMVDSGACLPKPTVILCLAAGKIANVTDREGLNQHFKANRWLLFDRAWIVKRLMTASNADYENDVIFVVTKLLLHEWPGGELPDFLRLSD
jgi:hypothetical protein